MNNISIFCITIISLFCKYNIIRFIRNNCNKNIILLPALSGASGGRVRQSLRASGPGCASGKCSQEKAIEHTQIPNHPHLPTTLTHLPHKKAEPPDSAYQTIIFVQNSTPLLTPVLPILPILSLINHTRFQNLHRVPNPGREIGRAHV